MVVDYNDKMEESLLAVQHNSIDFAEFLQMVSNEGDNNEEDFAGYETDQNDNNAFGQDSDMQIPPPKS